MFEHLDDLVLATGDTPTRGLARAEAAKNMVLAGQAWNRNRREGNMPIPLGGVATLSVHHVDRAHPDAKVS